MVIPAAWLHSRHELLAFKPYKSLVRRLRCLDTGFLQLISPGKGSGETYQVGGVVESADSQDTLDALLQPWQPQDGGEPALDRSQLLQAAVAPVLRMLALQESHKECTGIIVTSYECLDY